MTLHTLNRSPFSHLQTCDDCLKSLCPGDALMLLEDGVLNILPASPLQGRIQAFTEMGGEVFVMGADLAARGLESFCPTDLQKIDMDGFVDLCVTHNPVQSWY